MEHKGGSKIYEINAVGLHVEHICSFHAVAEAAIIKHDAIEGCYLFNEVFFDG